MVARRQKTGPAGALVAKPNAGPTETGPTDIGPADSGPVGLPAPEAAALPLTVSRPELLVDGTDKAFRRLVHGLFGFLSMHETIRSGHARAIGLAGIEYTVLISIAHLSLEGEVNVRAVADHLHLTGAFITNVCQRLQVMGLIEKRTDPKDRRKVGLTITDEGRTRLAALAPVQRQVNDAEFGCLTRQEFVTLLDIVERLVESGERAAALQKYLETSRVAPVLGVGTPAKATAAS